MLLRRVPWQVLVRAGAPAADLAPRAAAGRAARRAGRGGRRPAVQLRRADPPAVHPRRHRRRRPGGARRMIDCPIVCARPRPHADLLGRRARPAGPDAEAPRLLCVEVHEGAPLSFMTETAAELLRAVDAARFVPTTTRTRKQSPGSACPARRRVTRSAPTAATCSSTACPTTTGTRGSRHGWPAVRPARRGRGPPAGDGGSVRAQAAGGERPLRLRRRRPRGPARRLGRGARGVGAPRGLGGVAAGPQGLRGAAAADQGGGRGGGPRPARRRHRCSRRATRCSTPTCSTSPTRRSAPPTASWPRRGSPETT